MLRWPELGLEERVQAVWEHVLAQQQEQSKHLGRLGIVLDVAVGAMNPAAQRCSGARRRWRDSANC